MVTSKTRILIVDDFAVVRLMLKRYLNELGFQAVDEANDGAQAMHRIREAQQVKQQYGMIFIDWSMPKMTGIEVLEECRKHPDLSDIPILLVTAESERKQVLKALTSGATDYVVKPFTLDVVRGKIEQLNKTLSKKK